MSIASFPAAATMLMVVVCLRLSEPAVAAEDAAGRCLTPSSYAAGDATGWWRMEARIGETCFPGPWPAWAAELWVLGIRAGIQHDAAGFASSVSAAIPSFDPQRFLPRLRPGG